jgi:hypothetical protein
MTTQKNKIAAPRIVSERRIDIASLFLDTAIQDLVPKWHLGRKSQDLTSQNIQLRARFVGDRLGGDEIGLKAGGVGIEKLLDAFGALGFQDEADVVIFGDAVGDFGIGVGGCIGMFLAGERKNDSGVVAAKWGKLVGLIPCSDFETRPFAPEVDAGGGLDDIGDVGAADAGGDFDEIKFAVGVRAQKFSMGDPAH